MCWKEEQVAATLLSLSWSLLPLAPLQFPSYLNMVPTAKWLPANFLGGYISLPVNPHRNFWSPLQVWHYQHSVSELEDSWRSSGQGLANAWHACHMLLSYTPAGHTPPLKTNAPSHCSISGSGTELGSGSSSLDSWPRVLFIPWTPPPMWRVFCWSLEAMKWDEGLLGHLTYLRLYSLNAKLWVSVLVFTGHVASPFRAWLFSSGWDERRMLSGFYVKSEHTFRHTANIPKC